MREPGIANLTRAIASSFLPSRWPVTGSAFAPPSLPGIFTQLIENKSLNIGITARLLFALRLRLVLFDRLWPSSTPFEQIPDLARSEQVQLHCAPEDGNYLQKRGLDFHSEINDLKEIVGQDS